MPLRSVHRHDSAGSYGGIVGLLVFFLAITAVTTFFGISEVLPGAWGWRERYGFSLGIAAVLAWFVYWAWRNTAPALSYHRWGAVAFWLTLGIVPSLASALLSSTIHMAVFSKLQLNEIAVGEARTAVLAPVHVFADQAQRISTKMTEFSAFASQRADLERDTGRSCQGQTLDTGCGPICRWRAAQAKDAESMAELAAEIDRQGAALSADAVTLDQAKINEIFFAARELARDPRFARINRWIAEQQEAFASGFQWEGARRQCSDPEALAKLAELVSAIGEKPQLPVSPPALREQTVGDSGTRNLHAIVKVLGLATQLNFDEAKAALRAPDVAPFVPFWGTSIILELLCALLSLAHGLARRPNRGLPRHLLSLVDQGEIGPAAQTRMLLMLRVHRSFKIVLGEGHTYFLTPIDGDASIRNNAEFYAYRMRLIECDVWPIDVEEVLTQQAPWLKSVSGGATQYRIWRYRRAGRYSVAGIERLLVGAVGLSAGSAGDSPVGPPHLQVINGSQGTGAAANRA